MNKCNVIRDLLPLYEDKETCAETTEAVRTHLESCADCREYYSHIRHIARAIQAQESRGRYRYSELISRIRRRTLVTYAFICLTTLTVIYLLRRMESAR